MRDMLKINRIIALLIAVFMLIALPACSGSDEAEAPPVAQMQTPMPNALPEAVETEPSQDEASQDEGGLDESGPAFESNDGFVMDFSAMQVMASGLDTDTGDTFDMTRFVAGKSTLMRIAFKSPIDVEQDGSMRLTVYHNGEAITELLPLGSEEHTYAAYFAPRKLSDVNHWAAGDYALEFTYGDSMAIRRLTMSEARKIKVLAVPVIANYAGRVAYCEGEWRTAIQFTRDTYPLADDGIEYVLGNELDLSDIKYDLTTDDGQYNVWEALTNLQTPNNDYELILGFVRYRQGPDSTLQGYTYGIPANIITESDGDMQPTVAHEIAHCYFVGDEYPGGAINNNVNPAPYGMEGSDYNDRNSQTQGMKEAVISANDRGNPNSGSLVFDYQIPVNVTSMQLLNNVGSFMGSGSDDIYDYWITSDIWAQLFKAFTQEGVQDESASSSNASTLGCPNCYEAFDTDTFALYAYCQDCDEYTYADANDEGIVCAECEEEIPLSADTILAVCPACENEFLLSQMQTGKASKVAIEGMAQAEPEELRVIDITGTVYASGDFRVRPWYAYEATSADISVKRSGEYAIVMEDASGKTLSTQYFDISFYTQSNPPMKIDYAPVNITARYPEGVAAIKITQSTKTLCSVSVSASAPEIAFTNIKEDQAFSGKTEIKWSASDEDGGDLYYELWYCQSEDEFINIATDITQTSYMVDFDALPGTQEGYFYLYATDGVNTSEVASEWIQVEYKAPEIITTQAAVPEYKLTDEILLDADIYDPQDGWLFDEGAEWTLNGREYMSGSLLWVYPYELSPGEHTFTLTATNSHGKTASSQFKFRVIDDESALPNDWSREDIKQALSVGFVAPLANVNAAITRGQFASLASNLYWELWSDGMPEPDYEENVVTDCGQDDYDQFLMVKLGLMEAPGGKFNPNGNLTEEEAAVILYRVCAISTPEGEDPSETAQMMVEACLEAGVMGQSGDNAYNASENITGRLALVRCNRLYQFIFGDE